MRSLLGRVLCIHNAGVCLRVCFRVCVRVFVSWLVRVCPVLVEIYVNAITRTISDHRDRPPTTDEIREIRVYRSGP